ncbi:MAG: hypothetical protein FJ045_04650 [Crenarchaeota archaeon]|nr:hypothetical protein [Thermoproteota archaeon]
MYRRNVLILLSLIAIAVVIGSMMYSVYAADNEVGTNGVAGWLNGRMMGTCGRMNGLRHGGGPYGSIEVSEEYEENVINIAKNDPDVQELLNNGYNITAVRPIITTKVDAQSNVVTKTTNAIVILQKDTTSRASVWVDLEGGKVTKIVILTRTVIEKS